MDYIFTVPPEIFWAVIGFTGVFLIGDFICLMVYEHRLNALDDRDAFQTDRLGRITTILREDFGYTFGDEPRIIPGTTLEVRTGATAYSRLRAEADAREAEEDAVTTVMEPTPIADQDPATNPTGYAVRPTPYPRTAPATKVIARDLQRVLAEEDAQAKAVRGETHEEFMARMDRMVEESRALARDIAEGRR